MITLAGRPPEGTTETPVTWVMHFTWPECGHNTVVFAVGERPLSDKKIKQYEAEGCPQCRTRYSVHVRCSCGHSMWMFCDDPADEAVAPTLKFFKQNPCTNCNGISISRNTKKEENHETA